eukprot:Skav229099  [mRNA]  locus=scaffold92:313791:319370:- [translate_table: standard]
MATVVPQCFSTLSESLLQRHRLLAPHAVICADNVLRTAAAEFLWRVARAEPGAGGGHCGGDRWAAMARFHSLLLPVTEVVNQDEEDLVVNCFPQSLVMTYLVYRGKIIIIRVWVKMNQPTKGVDEHPTKYKEDKHLAQLARLVCSQPGLENRVRKEPRHFHSTATFAMDLQNWKHLILDADVIHNDKLFKSGNAIPRNVLVTILGSEDAVFWDAKLLAPAGTPGRAVLQDFPFWQEEHEIMSVKLMWNPECAPPQCGQKLWILGTDTYVRDDDCRVFTVTPSSCVIPITTAPGKIHVLECFGGGYGGWKFALSHLKQCHDLPVQVISIENCALTCCCFAATHDVPIFNGHATLSADFFEHLPTDCILWADAAARTWLRAIAKWHPTIMCVSAPCPPWSAATDAKGLSCPEGMLLPECLMQAKWLKPEYILIEQVAGFHRHRHKKHVIQVLHNAGYVHTFSRVFDLSHCAPAHRPRWLAIFRRADVKPSNVPFDVMQSRVATTPMQFDVILPDDLVPEGLKVTSSMLSIVSNPTFVKGKRPRESAQVFESRCHDGSQCLPVFMAAYGSQHTFSSAQLHEHGCFAHFFKDSSHVRMWSDIEVAMIHFAVDAFFLPADRAFAYRILGNQITVPQAMQVIAHALRLLGFLTATADDIMTSLLDMRINATTMNISKGVAGTFVTHDLCNRIITDQQHAVIQDFMSSLGRDFMDPDVFWDLNGFHVLQGGRPGIALPTPAPDTVDCISVTSEHPSEQAASEQESPAFSQTLQFTPVVLLHAQFSPQKQKFWISGDVCPQDVSSLWKLKAEVISVDGDFHLIPHSRTVDFAQFRSFLICHVDEQFTIYTCPRDEDLDSFLSSLGPIRWFTIYGPLESRLHMIDHAALFEHPINHTISDQSAAVIVAAFQMTVVVFDYESTRDAWIIRCTGDSTANATLARLFATALHPDTLKRLGRTVHVLLGQTCTIEFRPIAFGVACPPDVFDKCIAVAVTRAVMDSIAMHTGPLNMPQISIKFHRGLLWKGHLDPKMEVQSLCVLMTMLLSPVCYFKEQRCVARGKHIQVGALGDHIQQDTVIHLIQEMCGGAGSGPSTKTQLRQQARNALASSLLEQGIDLQWVQSHLDRIIDGVGIKRVVPILQQPAGVRKDAQIRQFIADCNVLLPEKPKHGPFAPQTLRSKAKRRGLTLPNVQDFQVECAALKNEDDTAVQQLTTFGPNVTGVFLTSPNEALPWIRGNKVISSDELAILLVGSMPCECTLPMSELVIPCSDKHDRKILLQCTMIQFGEKKISPVELDNKQFAHAASKVVAFTFWRSDWKPEDWTSILKNTTQFLRDAFKQCGGEEAIISCWGRSLRNGKTMASVHDATSIQLHSAVSEAKLNSVLGLSGFNRIWASPKTEEGKITDDFRVIWMPAQAELQDLVIQSANLPGLCGLIKSRSSFGLRIQSARFQEAWAQIKPDEPLPSMISTHKVYRIEPLPIGCNPRAILEWSSHIGWPLRPIRPLGPRSWLVGTEVEPPQKQIAFNGQRVLPVHIPPKTTTFKSPILAGPRNHVPVGEDPWKTTGNDPWSSYTPTTGGASNPIAAAAPRTVTGPQEQRFQEQDAKLSDFAKQIQVLTQRQDEQGAQLTGIRTEVQQVETKLTNSFSQALSQVKQDITSSFAEALQQQNKQFDHNMQQIRSLMAKSTKRKPQEPKSGEDAEMSEEG